jgi:hypothetical protein
MKEIYVFVNWKMDIQTNAPIIKTILRKARWNETIQINNFIFLLMTGCKLIPDVSIIIP